MSNLQATLIPYIKSLRHSAANARDVVQRATQMLYDISLEPNSAQRQMLISKLYETILKQIRTASQDLQLLQNIISSKGAVVTGNHVGATDAERAQRLAGMALLQPKSQDFAMQWVDIKNMEAMMDDFRALLDIYHKSQLEYPFFVSESNESLKHAILAEIKEFQGDEITVNAPFDRSEETFDHIEERVLHFSRLCAELSQTADALADHEYHQQSLEQALIPTIEKVFSVRGDSSEMDSGERLNVGQESRQNDIAARLASQMLANLPPHATESPVARLARFERADEQLQKALKMMFKGEGLR